VCPLAKVLRAETVDPRVTAAASVAVALVSTVTKRLSCAVSLVSCAVSLASWATTEAVREAILEDTSSNQVCKEHNVL
jgi:hypothetical protein